jgi:hypothetical protein
VLTEEEWHLFSAGGAKDPLVIVCRMREEVVEALRCSSVDVRLSSHYANKARLKHRLSPGEFLLLPGIIRNGECLRLSSTKVVFLHQPDGLTRSYEVVVKTTAKRHQLWIDSFHRQTKPEIRRKKRRYNPIPKR